jgi:hypothetical protein
MSWWAHENRWSSFIFIVPFLLLGFPVAVVTNLMHGRALAALGSLVFLAFPLVILSLDFLSNRRHRPWNKPPWHDPENTGAPWNRP